MPTAIPPVVGARVMVEETVSAKFPVVSFCIVVVVPGPTFVADAPGLAAVAMKQIPAFVKPHCATLSLIAASMFCASCVLVPP